jgi:DNA polymerase III gamma/tau subunit
MIKRLSGPLYIKYRPQSLDEIIGNDEIVMSLQSIIAKPPKEREHTFLFTGEKGSGKTTFARILKTLLQCHDVDFKERNAANTRGIETIREDVSQCSYAPMGEGGKSRIYFYDECFASGTLVSTCSGTKPIEDIEEGEEVFNLIGRGKVKKVFKNKVPFERIVKIKFINGINVVCSKEHLFLTNLGWKEAIFLTKNDLLFDLPCNTLRDIKLQGDENNGRETMPRVQRNVSPKKKKSKILLSELCREMEKQTTRVEEDIYSGKVQGNIKWATKIERGESFSLEGIERRKFRKNEEKQPDAQRRKYRKDDDHEKDESNFEYLLRNSGWEWTPYNSSENPCTCVRLGNGSTNLNKTATGRISKLLQSRCRESEIESCNRNRWSLSPVEKSFIEGQKERGKAVGVRVESIEILQQRSGGVSTYGIENDTGENKGFITFYDLQISNHPSYYVNNILVHNCHQITSAAAEALLKVTEDGAPPHVYFIFATTNPEKLTGTLKSRCTKFQVKTLNRQEMITLLRWVLKEEGREIWPGVMREIVKYANGIPREALVLLSQVINLESEEDALEVVQKYTEESNVIDLCRALDGPEDWKTVAKIINGIDEDVEKVRLAVLSYFSKALLSSGVSSHAQIMFEFSQPFDRNGKPGLILACYAAKTSK